MSDLLTNGSNPFIAAVAVGLSCGTACSPLINLFLTTYTLGRFNSMKRGLHAFWYFWLGKTAVVSLLASVSAVLGQAIIGQSKRICNFDLRLVLDVCLILTGICLLAGMVLGKPKTAAGCDCGECMAVPNRKAGRWPLVTMGVAYGLTPCPPLLLFLLMAAMLPPVQAIWVSLVFSIANSVSPLLLLTILAGWISQKMQREIPQLMRVFQISMFGLFIIAGGISLINHL